MATLTIRDLPDDIRDKLRARAVANGRSVEVEARAALSALVATAEDLDRQACWDEAVRDAQEAFVPFRNADVSIADDLIADRRLEAWRETVETYRKLNDRGRADPPERRNARR